jgi:hypothetical protein
LVIEISPLEIDLRSTLLRRCRSGSRRPVVVAGGEEFDPWSHAAIRAGDLVAQ